MKHMSSKKESFCRYVASGLNPTEAYREAYNVTSDRKSTATEAASRLMSDSNVTAMIESMKLDISDKLASEIVWDRSKIIEELSINVSLGRETKQLAASNQAIKLIGSAVGNVFEPETQQLNSTVSVIHSLSDSVLEQLEALSMPSSVGPTVTVDDTTAIEADYSIIEPDQPQKPRK